MRIAQRTMDALEDGASALRFGARIAVLFVAAAAGLLAAPGDAVAACVAEPRGVIGWYRAEGNAGDSRGGNHGTNVGTYAPGLVGQAFSFNGTSGYVSVPDSATLRPASVTIEGWVKFSSITSLAMIASKRVGTSTWNSYTIYLRAGSLLTAEIGDAAGNVRVEGTWNPVAGTWYHVAMTFDNATRTLTAYLDGTMVASAFTGKSMGYDTNSFLIGVEDDGSFLYHFPGLIDELTLYSGALTAAEIQSISNAGPAGKCAPTTVTNTSDDGNAGSLRYAINYANSNCSSLGPHTITFEIPGAGPHVIAATGSLPAVGCSGTVLDGYPQPVEIDGSAVAACSSALEVSASSSNVSVQGLSFTGWSCIGVDLAGSGNDVLDGMFKAVSTAAYMRGAGNGFVGNLVDGTTNQAVVVTGTGNVVSANTINAGGYGVYVEGDFNIVQGNVIANGAGSGIEIIGSGTDLDANVVHDNGAGILIWGSDNVLSGNTSYSNGGPGIDLAADGITPNDEGAPPYDQDSGPNGLQNHPVITSVVQTGTDTIVTGTLKTAPGNGFAIVDLYANGTMPSTTQGETYIGETSFPLDANGCATGTANPCEWQATFPGTWNYVSATATIAPCIECSLLGTSEYSPAVAAAGPAAPAVTLSASSVAFGATTIGTTSPPQSVTLTNTGTAALNIESIVVSGDFAAPGCPSPGSLPAGVSCTFNITFTPAAIGARTGSITVTDDASGSPHVIALSGTGSEVPSPTAVLSSSSVAFGATTIGATSPSQVVTLTNTGSAALGIESIVVSGDFAATGCPNPGSLPAGVSCTFNITFTPTAIGARAGSITIVDNAPGSPRSIALSGAGVEASAPIASLSATSVTFPAQTVGTQSASGTVTLTNTGTAPLEVSGIVLSGDFAYTGCAFPSVLAPGASCTFLISFTPQIEGVRFGSIQVSTNAAGSPHAIELFGTGSPREAGLLRVSTTRLDFGELLVGETSPAQRIRVSNNGGSPIAISIVIEGPFSVTRTCPASLEPGTSCVLFVEFTPPSDGTHAGALGISGGSQSVTVSLQGRGTTIVPPRLSAPGSLDFGAVVVGESASRTLTLRNAGEGVLTIDSVVASGEGFALSGSCAPLAAGESCLLEVHFRPARLGPASGRVDIMGSNGRASVELLGEGVALPAPQLVLSPGSIGFGNQLFGTASVWLPFEVANVGNAALTLTGLTVTGEFDLENQCPANLEPGARCGGFIRFAPAGIGRREGALTVLGNDADSPHTMSLTGSGCMPYSVRSRLPRLLCGP